MHHFYTRDSRRPESLLEDPDHAGLRHVPANAKPSSQPALPPGLEHHTGQPLVAPLGLEVGVEPLVVLARLAA